MRFPHARFSVRTLMVLVLVVGGGFGWIVHRAHVQRDAVAAIKRGGGEVLYEWHLRELENPKRALNAGFGVDPNGQPKWPKWFVDRLGVDYFGSVKYVRLSYKNSDALMPHSGRLDRLEYLSIHDARNTLTDMGLAHLQGLTNLRFLSIASKNASVTRAGLENLKGKSRLQALTLWDVPLSDDDLATCAELTVLEAFWINSPRITNAGVRHLSGLVNMRALSLASSRVTDTGLSALAGMRRLQMLSLSQTGVSNLAAVRHLTTLNYLKLSGTPIGDAGLAPAAGFGALEELFLADTQVTDAGLVHVSGLTNLTDLQLSETRITDAGLIHLSGLKNLTRLSLDRTSITGSGLLELAKLTKLESITLTDSGVVDAGLAHLGRLPTLTSLELANTKITDAGLQYLVGSPSLEYLLLQGTDVTDAGLMQLTTLKNLKELYLKDTIVTKAGIAALQEACPALQIDLQNPLLKPTANRNDTVRLRLEAVTAAGEAIRKLHKKLGPPQPGEWLDKHPEAGQTFTAYQNSGRGPDATQTVIYLQPLGKFSPSEQKLLDATADYLGRFYGMPVKVSPPIVLDSVPDNARRINENTRESQSLTSYLRGLLKERRPDNAVAVLGLTTTDLWPGEGWNFVFGEASLTERVGVWSTHRLGNPEKDFDLVLLRTLKTAAHETGHMLGIQHCTAYECCMNGSNHLPESDRRPLGFCPEDEMKVWWTCRLDPVRQYTKLIEFADAYKMGTEAKAFRAALAALLKREN